MSFDRRKLEDQLREAAEKEAANWRATDRGNIAKLPGAFAQAVVA